MTTVLPRLTEPVGPPSGSRGHARGERRTKRREARRRRQRRLAVGAVVVLVVAALAGALTLVRHGGDATPAGTVAPHRTQTTLLLMVTGPDGNAVESALLAHDPRTGAGAVVLVPSETVADVPGHGQLAFGDTAAMGNPRLPAETLGDVMGVLVDGTVTLRSSALAALVDHVGGVRVDNVDTEVVAPGPGNTERVLVSKGGPQKLDGAAAVAYATHRGADENEQARLARFTAVLSGLVDVLPGDATAVTAQVQALGGSASFTVAPSRVGGVLAGLRADARAQNLAWETLPVQPVGTGEDQLTPLPDDVAQLVHRYLAASVPAGRASGHNRVIVVNGTGALGLGETAHAKLADAGLVFVRSENQQGFSFRHRHSVVLVPDDSAASRALGRRLTAALRLPQADVAINDQPTTAADAVVILGQDYRP